MRMRREEQKEFGVGVVDFLSFFSLFDRSFFICRNINQHDMSVVRKTECRYPINKHGKV